jgi:hypothetical protein
MEILDYPYQTIDEAIQAGEFPLSVINSGTKVAVVMSQTWCPQYTMMKRWMKSQAEQSLHPELKVYLLEYDGKPWFDRFLDFKENIFRNALVPYVRYYVDGKYNGDSNYVSPDIFHGRWEHK